MTLGGHVQDPNQNHDLDRAHVPAQDRDRGLAHHGVANRIVEVPETNIARKEDLILEIEASQNLDRALDHEADKRKNLI